VGNHDCLGPGRNRPGRASSRKGAWSDVCVIPLQNTKPCGVTHNSAAMGSHSFSLHDRGAGVSDALAVPAGLPPTNTKPIVRCNLITRQLVSSRLCPSSYHIGAFSSAFVLVDLPICRGSARPSPRNSVTPRGGVSRQPAPSDAHLFRRPILLEYHSACNLIAGSVQGPYRFLQRPPASAERSRTSP
jgi:hypothetical protein